MNEANCNPLTPEEMARLITALRKQKNRDLEMTVLLCYEAGLRLAEAFGLQWGDVWRGKDDSDTTRRIHIQRSRQGNRVGLTSKPSICSRRWRWRFRCPQPFGGQWRTRLDVVATLPVAARSPSVIPSGQ